MDSDEARRRISGLLGGEVRFEGHFDQCFEALKESQRGEIIAWIAACKEGHEHVYPSYKNQELLGFIKRIGSNLRAILTKQKNGWFLALFLDKHKYYEAERDRLGF